MKKDKEKIAQEVNLFLSLLNDRMRTHPHLVRWHNNASNEFKKACEEDIVSRITSALSFEKFDVVAAYGGMLSQEKCNKLLWSTPNAAAEKRSYQAAHEIALFFDNPDDHLLAILKYIDTSEVDGQLRIVRSFKNQDVKRIYLTSLLSLYLQEGILCGIVPVAQEGNIILSERELFTAMFNHHLKHSDAISGITDFISSLHEKESMRRTNYITAQETLPRLCRAVVEKGYGHDALKLFELIEKRELRIRALQGMFEACCDSNIAPAHWKDNENQRSLSELMATIDERIRRIEQDQPYS